MYLAVAGILLYFWPRASIEWIVSMVVAFIAAYFTVADKYWFAPIYPFMGWYVADYAILQFLFWRLNKRWDRAKAHA